MTTQKELSNLLVDELQKFFTTHSPAVFHSKLRSVVLDFLDWKIKNDSDSIPPHCEDFLWTLNDFLDILEIASTEFNNKQIPA